VTEYGALVGKGSNATSASCWCTRSATSWCSVLAVRINTTTIPATCGKNKTVEVAFYQSQIIMGTLIEKQVREDFIRNRKHIFDVQ